MTIEPTQLEMLAAFAEKLSENAPEGSQESEWHYRERERILNLTIPGMSERRQHQVRSQMLCEHTRTYDDASRVFDWNMQAVYPLRRRQAQLQRQLDKM